MHGQKGELQRLLRPSAARARLWLRRCATALPLAPPAPCSRHCGRQAGPPPPVAGYTVRGPRPHWTQVPAAPLGTSPLPDWGARPHRPGHRPHSQGTPSLKSLVQSPPAAARRRLCLASRWRPASSASFAEVRRGEDLPSHSLSSPSPRPRRGQGHEGRRRQQRRRAQCRRKVRRGEQRGSAGLPVEARGRVRGRG